jgi:hypothetical protein
LEGNLLKPGNPYCGLSADQRLAAEELKYILDGARQRQRPTNNMFGVWQNLAPFGGRPIGGTIEVLLTKVNNQQYCRLLIPVFFVAAALMCQNVVVWVW